jgi:methanogenic corrinoid protein MtbC1
MSKLISSFTEALLSMDRLALEKLLATELQRTSPIDFVEKVIVRALERIGEDWQQGTVSLSQVYMGGRLCEQLVDDILPPAAPERKHQPKMAICTLADHHKLGKSIVYSILRASGFELTDYDTVEVVDLVEHVKNDQIKILLISVLMLSSALKIKEVKEELTANALKVKIIVGGAPFRFDADLWKEVGADGMCRSASDVAKVINTIVDESL